MNKQDILKSVKLTHMTHDGREPLTYDFTVSIDSNSLKFEMGEECEGIFLKSGCIDSQWKELHLDNYDGMFLRVSGELMSLSDIRKMCDTRETLGHSMDAWIEADEQDIIDEYNYNNDVNSFYNEGRL